MGMDLAKKTYSTEPEYFIAGTAIGIKTAVKEASAAVKKYAPVLLDGGKIKPVASATTLTGLYGIAADSAASGDEIPVYLAGEFFADKLELESGVTAAALEVAFRNIGIFLVDVPEESD